MSELFLKVLNMTLNASWLILAVMAARLFLKRAPRWVSCLLWALVAFRLICPVSLNSALSLLPSGEVVPINITMQQDPHIYSGISIIDDMVNPAISETIAPDPGASVNPMQVAAHFAGMIWMAGMIVMCGYALISSLLLKRRVRISSPVSEGVYECDEVKSPFILGVFRPSIYVPSGMDQGTLAYVTAHERAHLSRLDHVWKPLGFLLLSVYWFNPLCWVAYALLCRDIESACDEKVIRDKDRDFMAAYSQALLDHSVQRRVITACPLAFGETDVKSRVRGVLNYKKPAFWVIILSVAVCIIIAVCFITDPLKDAGSDKALAADEENGETAGNDPEQVENNQNDTIQADMIQNDTNQTADSETEDTIPADTTPAAESGSSAPFLLTAVPVDTMVITRSFDLSEHPETDFAGQTGTPIYAVCDGSVVEAGFDEAAGNYMIITPGTNPSVQITYSHLDSMDVKAGDAIKSGDVICTLGNTGHSTGPHLGLKMTIDGRAADIMESLPVEQD